MYTKDEALAKINQILDDQFDACLVDTYNRIIAELIYAESQGKVYAQRSIVVGANPFNPNYEDVRFEIDKSEIANILLDTVGIGVVNGENLASVLLKLKPKYNIGAYHNKQCQVWSFAFIDGIIFRRKTKTGKMFAEKLKKLFAANNVRLSFAAANEHGDEFKITYYCDLLQDCKDKSMISAVNLMIPITLEEVSKKFEKIFAENGYGGVYAEMETAASQSFKMRVPSLNNRVVVISVVIEITTGTIAVAVELGKSMAGKNCALSLMADRYNAEKVDGDFSVTLSGGVESEVRFIKSDLVKSLEDMETKIAVYIPEAIKFCEDSRVYEFLDVTCES